MAILLFLILMVTLFHIFKTNSTTTSKHVRKSFAAVEQGSLLDRIVQPIANLITPFVKLNPYKRETLVTVLNTVGIQQTPEKFTAKNLGLAVFISLFGIPGAYIFPLLGIVPPALGVYAYFSESKYAVKLLQEKRTAIELELPRFSSTISNALSDNKTNDVLKILESYYKVAGAAMKSELQTTIADIKTGNLQNALRNFENRINSHKLSELIRGLLSVSYGDDQTIYFQIKANEFRNEYREIRKRQIGDRPNKLSRYNMLTFLAIFLMLLAALAGNLMGSLKLFF